MFEIFDTNTTYHLHCTRVPRVVLAPLMVLLPLVENQRSAAVASRTVLLSAKGGREVSLLTALNLLVPQEVLWDGCVLWSSVVVMSNTGVDERTPCEGSGDPWHQGPVSSFVELRLFWAVLLLLLLSKP